MDRFNCIPVLQPRQAINFKNCVPVLQPTKITTDLSLTIAIKFEAYNRTYVPVLQLKEYKNDSIS